MTSKNDKTLDKFRTQIPRLMEIIDVKEINSRKNQVISVYQPMFQIPNISEISADDFKSFLIFKNNCHWNNLHRHGNKICKNIDTLRVALTILVDETKPIRDRFNESLKMISGFGKAVATAILQVAYPENYGVWNNISEGGLKQIGLWPPFERNLTPGDLYLKINEILIGLSKDLEIDLWTLDTLWWGLTQIPSNGIDEPDTPIDTTIMGARFALEKYLHEFMRDNWNLLELAKEWELFQSQDDPDAGFEYPTDIGYIDLLAKHKRENRWLVIELKRNQTSDDTVGQILRYMGYIQEELAIVGHSVEGLIIAFEADKKIRYALKPTPNIKVKLYQIDFRLIDPK